MAGVSRQLSFDIFFSFKSIVHRRTQWKAYSLYEPCCNAAKPTSGRVKSTLADNYWRLDTTSLVITKPLAWNVSSWNLGQRVSLSTHSMCQWGWGSVKRCLDIRPLQMLLINIWHGLLLLVPGVIWPKQKLPYICEDLAGMSMITSLPLTPDKSWIRGTLCDGVRRSQRRDLSPALKIKT